MLNKFSTFIIIAALAVSSCKKETLAPVQPQLPQPEPVVEMDYTDLNNKEVKYNQSAVVIDINKDGTKDLFFGVMLVGDNINKVDKRRYQVISSLYTALPVNSSEQVPVLNVKDMIPLNDFNGHNWYNAAGIILMERNEFATGAIVWRGNWLDAAKKYLPFQFLQNNLRYNGWVELTGDKTGERLVLHRLAISKHAEKNVKAGE